MATNDFIPYTEDKALKKPVIPSLFSGTQGMQRSIANINPEYRNQQGISEGGASSADPGIGTLPDSSDPKYDNYLNDLISNQPDYTDIINPTGGVGEVVNQANLYGGKPSEGAQPAFEQYLSAIDAPSSVEEVQKRMETEALNAELATIDRETESNVADVNALFQERGLGGVGQISDIEANAIARTEAEGGRTKSGARVNLTKAQLARESEREKMKINAYGQAFQMFPQLASLDQRAKETIMQIAEQEADRIAKQELGIAELSANDRNVMIRELFGQLQSMDKNQLTKSIAEMELAMKERQFKANQAWQRELAGAEGRRALDAAEDKPSFWEGLGQSVLTSGIGGFAGGAGTKLADKLL